MVDEAEFCLKEYVQDLNSTLECLVRLIENLKNGKYDRHVQMIQEIYNRLALRIGNEDYVRDFWILYEQVGG